MLVIQHYSQSSSYHIISLQMNLRTIHKTLLISISIISILIFCIPFNFVFYEGSDIAENNGWHLSCLFENPVSTIIYMPFTLLWYIFLFMKNKKLKIIFKALLTISGLISFFISSLSFILLSPDYEPYIGVFISLLILPFFICFLFVKYKLNTRNIINQSSKDAI